MAGVLALLITSCSHAYSETAQDVLYEVKYIRDGFENIEYAYFFNKTYSEYAPYIEEIYVYVPEPIMLLPDELTFENVLTLTNERRQVVHVPNMKRIQSWINARDPIILDGTNLFNSTRASSLSKEEAIYDMEMLFRLLRHMYAAYHYFGGDEIFLPMQEAMLEEIALQERWSYNQLAQLVQNNLGEVIIDNHFIINGYSGSTFNNPHHTFIWNTPFDRSERGFRERETGLYVAYVEGYDVNTLFRLTVNEAGEFYYAPVIFRRTAEGIYYTLHITFENGEHRAINLVRTIHNRAHANGASSSLRFVNNIPIVSIRRMGDSFNPYTHRHQEALQVLAYAEALRNEPVFILDIRSNEGGASSFSYQWLYKLMGEVVPPNFNWLGFFDAYIHVPEGIRRPERWYVGFGSRAGFDFEYPPELFGHYLHMTPIANNIFFTPEEAQDRVIANDQFIIILIDRFTLSSGETFADQFTNIENTLIIGQNTMGMLLTSSGLPLYLPHSGMPVSMGRHMLVHPDDGWEEGIGISPDVWVVGDALTAALAMLYP